MHVPDASQPFLREREIHFRAPHPSPDQAARAAELLRGLPGILDLNPRGALQLQLRYDLRQRSLADIEQRLSQGGLHLDNSLIAKLRRALTQYVEENLAMRLAEEARPGGELNDQIHVCAYQRLRHGCRDQRPEHWRHYL